MSSTRTWWLRLGWLALMIQASPAHAQLSNRGVMDDALLRLRTAAQGWEGAMLGAGSRLFWALAVISLVWTMGQLVLRRAELGEVFGELVRFVMLTGFWAWMLTHGAEHARMIMESFQVLGGDASARSVLSPSSVVDVGFHLLERVLTQSSILSSPIDTAVGIVLAFVILVILALVAINMLVLFASVWFVAYGGLIVLGFGGSRWTSDMAINYYRMVLSLGLQVLAMALVVGVGQGMIEHYAKALGTTDIRIQDQAVLLVVAIMLLALVNKVPPLVGTLANGSSAGAMGSGFGFGDALSAASTAVAGAALAKTALSAAGGSVASGVMAAYSAGSALRASAMDAASLWGDFEGHEGRKASDAAPPDAQEHDDSSSSDLTDEQEHGDRNDDNASHAQPHATEPEAGQHADGAGKQHSPSSTSVRKSPQRFTGDRQGAQSSSASSKASRAAAAIEPDRLLAEFDSSGPASAGQRMQASKPSGRTAAALDRGGSVQAPRDSAPARDATNASPPAQAAGQSQHAMGPASAAASVPAVGPAERTTGAAPVVAGGALASALPMVSSAAQYSAALPAQPPPPAGALAVAPTVWSLSAAGSSTATPGSSASSVAAGGAHSSQQSSVRDFGGLIAGYAEGGAAPAPALAATPQSTPQLAPPSTAAAPTNEFSVNVEDEVAAFRERG